MNKVKVRAGGGAVRLPYHGEDEEEQEAVDVDDELADADGNDRGAVEACDGGEELFGVQVHGRLLMLLRVVGILRGLLRVVDAGCLGAVGHVDRGLVSDGEVLANVGIEAQGDENEQAEFADGEHEVEERGEQAVEVLEEVNHSDENFLEISGLV